MKASRSVPVYPFLNQTYNATRPLDAIPRVMPLGDSITEGAQNFTHGGFREGLTADLVTDGRTVLMVGSGATGAFANNQHEGHSGYYSQNIIDGLWRWLDDAQPQVVLLGIGTNDCAISADVDGLLARVGLLIDMTHMWSRRCWISVRTLTPFVDPVLNARVDQFNAALNPQIILPRAAAGRRVHHSIAGSSVSLANISGDNVHPTPVGYGQMQIQHRSDVNAILNVWV